MNFWMKLLAVAWSWVTSSRWREILRWHCPIIDYCFQKIWNGLGKVNLRPKWSNHNDFSHLFISGFCPHRQVEQPVLPWCEKCSLHRGLRHQRRNLAFRCTGHLASLPKGKQCGTWWNHSQTLQAKRPSIFPKHPFDNKRKVWSEWISAVSLRNRKFETSPGSSLTSWCFSWIFGHLEDLGAVGCHDYVPLRWRRARPRCLFHFAGDVPRCTATCKSRSERVERVDFSRFFFSTIQRCKEMRVFFFYLPSLPSNWCSPRQLRWIELLCQGIARRVTNVSTADVHSNVSLDAERPSVERGLEMFWGFPWNRAHWPTLQSSMKAPFKTEDSIRNRAALRLRSRNGPRGVRARRATVSRSAARCRRGAVVLGSWAKRWGTAMVVLELEGQLPSCRCFQNCWGFNKQMQKFTFLDKQSGSPSKSPWKEKHLLKLDLGVNAFWGRANVSTGKQND